MTKQEALDLWYTTPKILEAESAEEEILAYVRAILRADRKHIAELECVYCLDYIKKANLSVVPAEYIEANREWLHVYHDPAGIVRLRNRCRGSAIRNLPIFDVEQEKE